MISDKRSFAQRRANTLKSFCTVATISAATMLSGNAAANAISGGVTQVALDAAVADLIVNTLGVTPEPTGTATFETLTFSFPITGGNLSDSVIPGSSIEHDGSGIKFSKDEAALSIGDFVIDTTELIIFGAAETTALAAPLADVPLFALALPDDSGVEGFPFSVALTDTSAFALNATFGVDVFTVGTVIGTAATAPQVAEVPAPATLSILALGLAAVGWRKASSKKAALAC